MATAGTVPPRFPPPHSNRSKHSAKATERGGGKREKIIQMDHKQLLSRETLCQSLLWAFCSGEARGEVTGCREEQEAPQKQPHGALPPAFPPHRCELRHEATRGCQGEPLQRGRRSTPMSTPALCGLGERGATRRPPRRRQRRGAPSLRRRGCSYLGILQGAKRGVSVKAKQEIMSESTLPPIPR